jgi:molybdate transport system substrate-binding protein
MSTSRWPKRFAAALLSVSSLLWSCDHADSAQQEIRVAVASNFTPTLNILADRFEQEQHIRVVIVSGSTGKLYAQIKNGAPFDVFLAADEDRPQALEQEGEIIAGSRFTYAIGRLILWSPIKGYVQADTEPLIPRDCRHLAIANPKLAPYGRAAQEVLQARGMWESLSDRFVRGENVGQAFQFVDSQNAQAGFVAYSQVKRPGQEVIGSYWLVPQELYAPIKQQAVLLKDDAAASSFLEFLRSESAAEILTGYGYEAP